MPGSPTSFPRSRRGDFFSGQRTTPPDCYFVAHIDGGSRGNPGPAGYGVFITNRHGHKVASLSDYLGRQTNNYAEYQGLLAALDYALTHEPNALAVIADSELLVKQVRGEYKVKSPALQDLYRRAREMIARLEWFSIQHVLRESNREADRLANEAMDKGMGRSSLSPAATSTVGTQELSGTVRNGVIVLESATLPEGTRVQVRVRR
jgi:ribonuclease HI